ncbi:MAG: metal-dependent hydrolase [Nanobdellota archaeon]
MEMQFLGHAGFRIDNLVIDPYVTQNENVDVNLQDIHCDIICVTHDHFDHMGDTYALAKQNDATIVACAEIAFQAQKGGYKAEPMNIGGTITVGDWQIHMVEATHSSGSGTPTGFILKKPGCSIYHAGDTGLFEGMKLFARHEIDIAMLPIGDRFTMGAKDAAKAAEFISCKRIIPMHYNTWPPIEVDPQVLCDNTDKEVIVFQVGEKKQL